MTKTTPFAEIAAATRADPASRERIAAYKRAIDDALELGRLRDEAEKAPNQATSGHASATPPVVRIEREEDIYLSSLRGYVEELGGRLEVAAIFPDQTVVLAPPPPKRRAKSSRTAARTPLAVGATD